MTFTTDEIIAMAKEARISELGLNIDGSIRLLGLFERFAALVAAKEREAILKLIEELDEPPYTGYENPNTWDDALIALSALVRARGSKEGA